MWSDEQWSALQGGYRAPYNPKHAVKFLATSDREVAWKELWENLHHQGDVGTASYAAIPEIVRLSARWDDPDANLFQIASTIEEARLRNSENPPIPEWIKPAYNSAWLELTKQAIQHYPASNEYNLVSGILSVLAFAKGHRAVGIFANYLTEDEQYELLGI
ncbi:hypothetical protein [Phyllobacterium sp. 22552]|uniref:hypothetical protein n=1 Tax=Phyllobacterium sp. 22552 TaxID=3453941 RepID=UPI003F83A4E7